MSKLILGMLGLGAVGLVLSQSSTASAVPVRSGAPPGPGPGPGPGPRLLPQAPVSKQPSAGPTMPPSLVADIDAARASGDPLQLWALASRVQALGFSDASYDILKLLDEIKAAVATDSQSVLRTSARPAVANFVSPGQPQAESSVVRSAPIIVPGRGTTTIPMVLPRAPGVTGANPPDVRQLQAGQLALSLVGRRAGTEDRGRVAKYQAVNQLKADGLYGPSTALSLAGFGIVPPTPFYWPRSNPIGAKRMYKQALLDRGQGDSARRQEWVAAANAVRL